MLWKKLVRRWRWWGLKQAGAQIPCVIRSDAPFFDGDAQGFQCGRDAMICVGARISVRSPGKLRIGDRFFLNYYAVIDCNQEIQIGDNVMIGPHAYIGDFDHDLSAEPSLKNASALVTAPVHIGNHVWIGAHSIILKGVTIGAGAVVAAGAVVTRDVPERTVVGGVPAQIIRQR